MFELQPSSPKIEKVKDDKSSINKYKNIINPYTTISNEDNYENIDRILEKEKQHNKSETWNKLDKTIKIQKLHQYAEKYGTEHALPIKDVKSLKAFFVSCMEKNKLQKTKEVNYNKDVREIVSIPSLHFHSQNRAFTLKNLDNKRVSTIKSLTPKRISEKNIVHLDLIDIEIEKEEGI
jgi:hypothetical protein